MSPVFFSFLLFLSCGINAYKVSFFGDSYISMPLQEAKLSTNVRLKFKTRQDNGLIFATAGRLDSCVLQMFSGILKLSIKIGTHPLELYSPSHYYLNDAQWHDVSILRYETNITFQIDSHFVYEFLPLNVGKFNIHFGIFIGGLGDFSITSVMDDVYFRGCISDVYYNNISILKRAKDHISHITVEHISWICEEEFDATELQPISFLESDSYTFLKEQQAIENYRLTFKTTQRIAPLMLGMNGQEIEFVEVINSMVKLTTGNLKNKIEVLSKVVVSDGTWHSLNVKHRGSSLELSVDDITTVHHNYNLTLSNKLEKWYFGGIPDKVIRKIWFINDTNPEYVLKGCIQHIHINEINKGFPDFRVTKSVKPECMWEFSCLEKNPCILSSNCIQKYTSKFSCQCDQLYCLRADFRESYSLFSSSKEIVQINPVLLSEGDSVYLTGTNIAIPFDYLYYKLTEHSIHFTIIQLPKYGSLIKIDGETNYNVKNFTYHDILQTSIKYIHNGNEDHFDQITLDLTFEQQQDYLDIFSDSYRFLLHFNITPVNDAPQLSFVKNTIFRLVENIAELFTSAYVQLEDSDSTPETLMYKVISPKHKTVNGNFEIDEKVVNTFSHKDILEKRVYYIVREQIIDDKRFEIFLEVSDGVKTSPIVALPVLVKQLQLKMINNTGLLMSHTSSMKISHFNLSFAANSFNNSFEIHYNIISQPQSGVIERKRMIDDNWMEVKSFTNRQLSSGQIRYRHTINSPLQDEFKFIVKCFSFVSPIYDFRIKFEQFVLFVVNCQPLNINGEKKSLITTDVLQYQTLPENIATHEIFYTIMTPPKYGYVLVSRSSKMNSNFTQADLDNNQVYFVLHQTTYSNFEDDLKFTVNASKCEGVVGVLSINYEFDKKLTLITSFQNQENIQVLEGGRATISKINFPIGFHDFPALNFNISIQPKHGKVCKRTHQSHEEMINTFTLSNLNSGEIQYCHDDSESQDDKFYILIFSKSELDFQFIASVRVDIKLRNDNIPYPSKTKTLLVVRGGTKIVTKDILTYLDADLDTISSQIIYMNVIASNGWIFVNDRKPNEFSQRDINENRIYFKHNEKLTDFGNITFIVSDGVYEVNGFIKTEANSPLISLTEKDLVLQENTSYILDEKTLDLHINFDIDTNYIVYEVIMEPTFGKLYKTNDYQTDKNFIDVTNFTHYDVVNQRVHYFNLNQSSYDSIRLKVKCNGIKTEGAVNFRIYPASYWKELKIKNNHTIYVEESKYVNITKRELEVFHESTYDPKEILYVMTSAPSSGYLKLESVTLDTDEFKHFDQHDINENHLSYVETKANSTSDYFTVDVTNGITWMRGLKINIFIVPKDIIIQSKPVKAKKGGLTQILQSHIIVQSNYYKSKIKEYVVIGGPKFGALFLNQHLKIDKFSTAQLNNKEIFYRHNGKISTVDRLKLVAVTLIKESIPFVMEFDINVSEAEGPVIVKKNNISCPKNGRVVLTNDYFSAIDTDNNDEEIVYYVTFIEGGKIVSSVSGKEEKQSFTQLDINNQIITFINSNPNEAPKFSFYVTDGQFNSSEETFHILLKNVRLETYQNNPLTVSPMGLAKISVEHLFFQTSIPNDLIYYKITSMTQFGPLLYESNDGRFKTLLTSFSQNDIENSRIWYYNTHQLDKLNFNDSFSFNAYSSYGGSLLNQKFIFNISALSVIKSYIKFETIRVPEGSTMPIKIKFSNALDYVRRKTGLLSQTFLIVCHEPLFGNIKITSESKANMNFLAPEDFYKNHVYYEHDHSDTTNDRVNLSIYLANSHSFICDITIPVIISSINDKPFNLLTQFPTMVVVNGENQTITHQHLLTQDTDTISSNIIYEIISYPSFGIMLKQIDSSTFINLEKLKNKFTQNDINEKRIIYKHFGPSKQTSFDFKVWDSKHDPISSVFTIKVIPVMLDCNVKRKTIEVMQGLPRKQLQYENFNVHTNINKYRLNFNISRQLTSGIYLRENKTTTRFNYEDLALNRISFLQQNFSFYNDNSKVTVYVTDVENVCHFNVNIRVKPFVIIDSVLYMANEEKRLSLTMERKSALFRPDSNIRFVVKTKPKWGFLTNILMSKESKNANTSISSFTYDQIEKGLIYYRLNQNNIFRNDTIDEFSYLVKTNLTEHSGYDTAFIHISSAKQTSSTDDDSVYSVDVKLNHYSLNTIAAISTLILILLILIFLFIKYILQNKNEESKLKNKQPPALPLPPGYIYNNIISDYTSNNSLTYSNQNMPIMSSLPNCKIISLASSPFGDSQIDDFVNYEEDCDEMPKDWDSFKESSSDLNQSVYQNPLLRRNQYWV